jgi:CheY-like chemotaxis protein
MESPQEQKVRVLVVDDEAPVRLLVSVLLQDAGYEVDTAENGLVALEAMVSARPDVIVTDLSMPGLDGVGLMDRLHAAGTSVPVVVVSGEPDLEAIPTPYAPRSVLPKPFVGADLIRAVTEASGLAA